MNAHMIVPMVLKGENLMIRSSTELLGLRLDYFSGTAIRTPRRV